MAVNARSRQQGGRKKLLTGLAQEASNKIRSAVLLKGTASARAANDTFLRAASAAEVHPLSSRRPCTGLKNPGKSLLLLLGISAGL